MESKEKFRSISAEDIKSLISNNCTCNDWNRVLVTEGFDPSRCHNVTFSGDVRMGAFRKTFIDKSGVSYKSGISNAHVHNCTIGSDVLIANIGDYVANYTIEDDVVIKNCGKVHTEGKSSFGNGTEVAVLTETGGRSVRIWDRLSAHQAYITALYRHRYKTLGKLCKMVSDYTDSVSSETGTISSGTRILNCRNIRNVRFGPHSHAEGAISLNEGSVNSCIADPVFIGRELSWNTLLSVLDQLLLNPPS